MATRAPLTNNVPQNITLGEAKVFLTDSSGEWVHVGLTQQVNINIESEEVLPRFGLPAAVVARIRTTESASIQFTMAEFAIDKLKLALDGITESTGGEISARPEELTLNLTNDAVTEAGNKGFAFSSTERPVVRSLDLSTTYVEGVDWEDGSVNGSIRRIDPGGSIPDGATVRIDYTYVDPAAKTIQWGGQSCATFATRAMRISHVRAQDCLPEQFEFFKVIPSTTFSFSFQQAELIAPEVTFNALADTNRLPGQRLFKWTEGSAALC